MTIGHPDYSLEGFTSVLATCTLALSEATNLHVLISIDMLSGNSVSISWLIGGTLDCSLRGRKSTTMLIDTLRPSAKYTRHS